MRNVNYRKSLFNLADAGIIILLAAVAGFVAGTLFTVTIVKVFF